MAAREAEAASRGGKSFKKKKEAEAEAEKKEGGGKGGGGKGGSGGAEDGEGDEEEASARRLRSLADYLRAASAAHADAQAARPGSTADVRTWLAAHPFDAFDSNAISLSDSDEDVPLPQRPKRTHYGKAGASAAAADAADGDEDAGDGLRVAATPSAESAGEALARGEVDMSNKARRQRRKANRRKQ